MAQPWSAPCGWAAGQVGAGPETDVLKAEREWLTAAADRLQRGMERVRARLTELGRADSTEEREE